jgi:hypothetical protein
MYSGKFFTVLGVAAVVLAGMAATNPPARKHENLKVLPKDISNEELDIVMEKFEKALNVDCGFCHVKNRKDTLQWDYASDEKPEKDITLIMMRMTEKINFEFFDYKLTYKKDEVMAVSCYTCHYGSPRPELRGEKKE